MEADKRIPCKYGANCYQKNEMHLKKYKHDCEHEKRKSEESQESSSSPEAKRAKKEELAAEVAVDLSPQPEELKSDPKDVRASIKQKFLVDMPDDFYAFWEFCKSLNVEKPEAALSSCGLTLVGPFDVMSGALRGSNLGQDEYLRHWRYFYDPPEFQTVIRGDDKTQFHMGYFRDSPGEPPKFVGSNCAAENCVIKILGVNLFAAVNAHVTGLLKTADPFKKVKMQKVHSALHAWAKKEKIALADANALAARKRLVVCPSFHKAGLVVPYDKKTTVGYRELENDATLRKLLDKLALDEGDSEQLDSLINLANIANDECDFGTGLELGINLFCSGHEEFHRAALGLLGATYALLQRDQFSKILRAHLDNRRRGVELSCLSDKQA